MPAMVLIVTDLPAPLSPTSAVTWPAGTSRATSVRAWTGPKLLRIFSSRSRGVAASLATASAGDAIFLLDAGRRARRLGIGDADVGDLHGLVLDHGVIQVADRHPRRREVDGLHVGVGLRVLGGGVDEARGRGLPGTEEEGEGGGRLCLQVDRLVDRAALE